MTENVELTNGYLQHGTVKFGFNTEVFKRVSIQLAAAVVHKVLFLFVL